MADLVNTLWYHFQPSEFNRVGGATGRLEESIAMSFWKPLKKGAQVEGNIRRYAERRSIYLDFEMVQRLGSRRYLMW